MIPKYIIPFTNSSKVSKIHRNRLNKDRRYFLQKTFVKKVEYFMCVCMHMCAYVFGGQMSTSGIVLRCHPFCFWGLGLPLGPEAGRFGRAIWPVISRVYHLWIPSTGISGMNHQSAFHKGAGNRTPVLIIVQKAYYWLNHHPIPKILNLNIFVIEKNFTHTDAKMQNYVCVCSMYV